MASWCAAAARSAACSPSTAAAASTAARRPCTSTCARPTSPASAALRAPRGPPAGTDFSGSLAGAFTLDADFAAGSYRGQLRLDDLRMAYSGKQIANREPGGVDISPRGLQVRSFYLGEAGTGLEAYATGSIGLAVPRPLDLRVQSTISASWAKLFLPGLDIGGEMDLLATVQGTVGHPDLSR